MIITGITGGIGSGKTTVAKVWQELGAYVMYADEVAKDIMITDEKVRSQLIDAFGDDVYKQDGSLNRVYLSQEAFQKGRVEELNNIVHPAVYRRGSELIEEEKIKGTRLFVKEAALLLKNGRPDGFDFIVLCEADENVRVSRVTKRDGIQPENVKQRIAKQQSTEELRAYADIIIENNGTLQELQDKAKTVYGQMVS